jgi:hypothetical protein
MNFMDIPVNAKVYCQEHECGKTTCVVINPFRKEITHVVVQEKGLEGVERLVPIDLILASTSERITLSCTSKEFTQIEPFIEYRYVGGDDLLLGYEAEHYYMHPYLVPDMDEYFKRELIDEGIERIPAGEIGIHRGASIYATDGKIGMVDEFLISPADNHITHLVLQEGHLFGKKHITIPVSEIYRIEENGVHLKLSKQVVGELPAIPVRWHSP